MTAIEVVSLARRLCDLRDYHGYTLGDFALVSGVSKGYLSTLERGLVADPGLQTLERIADAYGISVSELLMAVRSTVDGEP